MMTEEVAQGAVLQVLDRLEEVTIRMHEALAFDKFEDLSLLVKKRQDLIVYLRDFDSISEGLNNSAAWIRNPEFRNKIDKLLLTGDALVNSCSKRLEVLAHARRQGSVVRATARGYKPYSHSPISTRKLET